MSRFSRNRCVKHLGSQKAPGSHLYDYKLTKKRHFWSTCKKGAFGALVGKVNQGLPKQDMPSMYTSCSRTVKIWQKRHRQRRLPDPAVYMQTGRPERDLVVFCYAPLARERVGSVTNRALWLENGGHGVTGVEREGLLNDF